MTTETAPPPAALEELFPPVDPDRRAVDLPAVRVTLLEDRAQVMRRGTFPVAPGRNRVVLPGVAPVLQDVSLRAEAASARVVDARVRRARRVLREHRPADVAALEQRIEELALRFSELDEDRARAEARQRAVLEMVARGIDEIPEDASWGMVEQQTWHDTLEDLFHKGRDLDARAVEVFSDQQDVAHELEKLVAQRIATDRPDSRLVAFLELDLEADTAGTAEVTVEYVVPNALWRPLHLARLTSGEASARLEVMSKAAVWQRTGEDWNDVELQLSTARSSLGTDPPLLSDDLLSAQRKADEVVVTAREVSIQRAGASGGGPAPDTLELPGVDDGGEIRNLKVEGRVTLPSDGRPVMVQLFSFTSDAETELVCAPELDEKAFLRARATHTGASPLLAGPVELVRDHGAVGWSKLLFVAPGERFELGFGPDEAVRITRRPQSEVRNDPIDGYHHQTTHVQLFLSNLEPSPREVSVLERMPVSEVEHVKVSLLADHCTPVPRVDDDGFCRWPVSLEAYGHARLRLAFRVSTAPGVRTV